MREETKITIKNFFKRFGLLILFAAVAVYAVCVLISQQSQLDEVNKRNEELSEQISMLEEQTADLEAELENAGSDSYSEDAARNKLGWVKEDELVFKEGENNQTQQDTEEQ